MPNLINFPKDRVRVTCEQNDVYLFIGGITEVKGIRLFCEAVTKANVKAIVIGQGILREELEEKYPNIEFVGWKSKEEMTPYLQKARCLIFPSIWYEVSPLTPLEVMAYGIPVICSNLNAASDFILDGINGLIYNGTSADELNTIINGTKANALLKNISEMCFKNFVDHKYASYSYIIGLNHIYSNILNN